ncbi:hypothetical protein [Bordetella petrii]|uniref:hypothetical protein n=1 Tax=Bordetella petrii TaxID=94624 RepID=UPI000682CAC4|nr:hypothetical protein [Bordetella petrii]
MRAATSDLAKPTRDQVQSIVDELSRPWGRVVLTCDGYEVTAAVRRAGALTFRICVYVNGWMRGEWLINDCEERRRFMRQGSRFLYSAKDRAEFIRRFGKRAARRHQIDRKIVIHRPDWTSARSMLKHFCSNNSVVTVQAIGVTAERPAQSVDGGAVQP